MAKKTGLRKSALPAKARATKVRPAKAAAAKPRPNRAAAGKGRSGDWRAQTLQRVRAIMRQADPSIVEDVKWRKPSNPAGVPVWSHPFGGMICTGETYKDKVKLTFARGAALADPSGLFNAGLDGNVRRAIDIREGERLNEPAFKKLVRAAVALNTKSGRPR